MTDTYVFPLPAREKTPHVKWREVSAPDTGQRRRWLAKGFNYGVDCGKSGLVVIDEDQLDEFARLAQDRGEHVPATRTVRTSKGRHYYFRSPGGLGNRNPLRGLGYHVDIRGDGGYVVGAGSTHPSGAGYHLEDDTDPVDLPEWLAKLLQEPPHTPERRSTGPLPTISDRYVQATVHGALGDLDALAALPEGGRDSRGHGWDSGTLAAARQLVRAANSSAGYSLETARQDFLGHAPPAMGGYSPDHKWADALKYVGQAPLTPKDNSTPARATRPSRERGEAMTQTLSPLDVEDFDGFDGSDGSDGSDLAEGEQHRGQARIAYRLAALYAGRLMYVRGLGWHVWDGTRWAADEKDTATTAVLKVLRAALAESLDDKELRSDVRKCETANGIAGVLSIASALPALRAGTDELDADPYLFNCANGTLDLRTRQLRPHDPADRITRVCRGAYTPGAEQGGWSEFLSSILPDELEREYLQRVIGQSVFGAVREHLFPVLTGTGANGKGTAYGAIAHAMGDYAAIIDPSLLMTRDRGGGGPEMMQLFGARLVIGSETEEGKQLDASLMKRLTGGDAITARHLYQPPVTWEPSHQMVYVTNHLPTVKGNDPAVWRRVRVIPFDVVVPEDQRDPALPERLKLAADAVLTWAVAGWFAYEDRGGMDEPDAVQRATDAYQTSSDAVKRFTQEHCLTGQHFHARSRELFAAWTEWAAADGADRLSEKAFGAELDRLRFGVRRTKVGNVRDGLGLPAREGGE